MDEIVFFEQYYVLEVMYLKNINILYEIYMIIDIQNVIVLVQQVYNINSTGDKAP